MLLPALLLALALAAPPAAAAPEPVPTDVDNTVAELLVIARRTAPDPSAVSTECLWRNLPEPERAAFSSEVGRAMATLAEPAPHRPNRALVTLPGVEAALRACGAPAEAEALPFARIAVAFYAMERASADRLAARGTPHARLEGAWSALSASQRDTLADQAGRVARGSGERPEAAARIIFGLIRRLRPINAFNPLSYKQGSVNHLIVAHYAPRAVRHAMEKRF
jgi:hypothetical protein